MTRTYDDWSHTPEASRLRYAADQRAEKGDPRPWWCPECGADRTSSHTLRVHRQIAHAIPSELEP